MANILGSGNILGGGMQGDPSMGGGSGNIIQALLKALQGGGLTSKGGNTASPTQQDILKNMLPQEQKDMYGPAYGWGALGKSLNYARDMAAARNVGQQAMEPTPGTTDTSYNDTQASSPQAQLAPSNTGSIGPQGATTADPNWLANFSQQNPQPNNGGMNNVDQKAMLHLGMPENAAITTGQGNNVADKSWQQGTTVDSDPNEYAHVTGLIESGGKLHAAQTGSNRGEYQFGPKEEAEFGINNTNRDTESAQRHALDMESERNTTAFEKVMGRAPSNSEKYLLHQQGLAGGLALLTNPNIPAPQALASFYKPGVAAKAISGNIPRDTSLHGIDPNNITSKQFTDMWANKYASIGGLRQNVANRVGEMSGPLAANIAQQKEQDTFKGSQVSGVMPGMEPPPPGASITEPDHPVQGKTGTQAGIGALPPQVAKENQASGDIETASTKGTQLAQDYIQHMDDSGKYYQHQGHSVPIGITGPPRVNMDSYKGASMDAASPGRAAWMQKNFDKQQDYVQEVPGGTIHWNRITNPQGDPGKMVFIPKSGEYKVGEQGFQTQGVKPLMPPQVVMPKFTSQNKLQGQYEQNNMQPSMRAGANNATQNGGQQPNPATMPTEQELENVETLPDAMNVFNRMKGVGQTQINAPQKNIDMATKPILEEMERGNTATQMRTITNVLRSIDKSGQMDKAITGPLAPHLLELSEALRGVTGVGLENIEHMRGSEIFNAVGTMLGGQTASNLNTRFSTQEFMKVLAAKPSILTTPEGRQALEDFWDKNATYQEKMSERATDVLSDATKNPNRVFDWPKERRDVAEKNPMDIDLSAFGGKESKPNLKYVIGKGWVK